MLDHCFSKIRSWMVISEVQPAKISEKLHLVDALGQTERNKIDLIKFQSKNQKKVN